MQRTIKIRSKRKWQRPVPPIHPVDRQTYCKFANRAPNFQRQIFGRVISNTPNPVPFRNVPKIGVKVNSTKTTLLLDSESPSNSLIAKDSQYLESTNLTPEPTLFINLELLLQVEHFFSEIIYSFKEQFFATIFNKCTEWWDTTAQLNLLETEKLFPKREDKLEQDRGNKLQLLAIVIGQYMAHEYNLSFSNNIAKTSLNPDEIGEISTILSALRAAHQSFLIFLRRVYVRTIINQTENRWIQEIKTIILHKLITSNSKSMIGTQRIHHEGMINLLKEICRKKMSSKFFNTAAMCLSLLPKVDYLFVRRVMCKELFVNVQLSTRNSSLLAAKKSKTESEGGCLLPQVPTEGKHKGYTLVLDLDETLVHSECNPQNPEESVINIRPGAEYFVEEMAKFYELVIFTAGTKEYADWALNFVDKKHVIKHRLYREHAVQKGLVFVKDISKLGRDMKRMIIIDNIVENFQLQPDNGIFINSWVDDPNDNSLLRLIPILKQIVEQRVPDVRIALRHYRDFQMRSILNKDKLKLIAPY